MAGRSGIGRVVKYSTGSGARYKAIVQYRGKKYIEGGFLTLTKARERGWHMKEELVEGTYMSPRQKAQQREAEAARHEAESLTVEAFCEVWLDQWRAKQKEGTVSANTVRTYKSAAKLHIVPLLGHKRLVDVTEEDVANWYKTATTGMAPATKSNTYRTLSSLMASAVRRHLIAQTPCRLKIGKVKPRDHKRQQHYFTHAEYEALYEQLQACDMPVYAGMAALVYYTACRPSEVRALRTRDIDLERKRIWYGSGMQRGENGETVEGPTKTRRGRWAPLPAPLIDVLTPLIEDLNENEWVFPSPTDPSEPASDKHVSGRVRKALDAIGLQDAELYDLKHTCLTNLGRAGASLKELMDLPGHTQIETVLKYQLSDFDRVASAVDRMVEKLDK